MFLFSPLVFDSHISLARQNWELSCLVYVHDLFHVFNVDTYFLQLVWWCMDNMCVFFVSFVLGGSNTLLLLSHMLFFVFCGLWKAFAVAAGVGIGQNTKKLALIALSQVDLVGKPVAAW